MSNATVELTIDDECTVYANGVPVEFVGWAGPDISGREDDAYHVADFFGNDGKYLGPDQHGTHPVFATEWLHTQTRCGGRFFWAANYESNTNNSSGGRD